MKDFSEFYRIILDNREYIMKCALEKVEPNVPDGGSPSQLAMNISCGISIEFSLDLLRMYHQWLHEED